MTDKKMDAPDSAIDPKFGQRIREKRLEKGLSIREVAEKAGCSPSQLTRLENAQRRVRSQQLLRSLSGILIIPYDELCELAGPAFQQPSGDIPLVQRAFPSIKNDIQESAVKEFASIISGSDITLQQKDKIIEVCRAYTEFFNRENTP